MTDAKLVIEGRRVKEVCQARQVNAKCQSGVVVDYLRFTFKRDTIPRTPNVPLDSDDENLAYWFAVLFAGLLGNGMQVGAKRPGRDYYEFTTTVCNEHGHEVGSVSAGGESQRGSICVTMKGEACTASARGWEQRIHRHFASYAPTITRVDLAKDFFHGEVDVSELVGLYQGHEFSYRNRRPKHECHGSWLNVLQAKDGEHAVLDLRGGVVGLDGGHSRTFQVGKRDSGKVFRGYEKGHQLGLMESRWLRGEVELRNVNRVIPWDCLVSPAEFYAGAYPACQLLANVITATPVPTGKKVAEASAQRCVNWVRRVVAPTLVQLVKVMPDFDWLESMVVEECNRRVPRSLRGLTSFQMKHGIEKALSIYSPNPAVAAGVGLS